MVKNDVLGLTWVKMLGKRVEMFFYRTWECFGALEHLEGPQKKFWKVWQRIRRYSRKNVKIENRKNLPPHSPFLPPHFSKFTTPLFTTPLFIYHPTPEDHAAVRGGVGGDRPVDTSPTNTNGGYWRPIKNFFAPWKANLQVRLNTPFFTSQGGYSQRSLWGMMNSEKSPCAYVWIHKIF